ncbi:hypothetical protein V4E86_20365 [Burkholderia pseudomallei]|uniref:Uncharacterized protein n=4 Tax=pseudomallei group TaxID=111527 RepID=A0AAX1XAR8_BURML|nr:MULTISPECIES: hypothetical protein [Burkholderia]ABN93703.1 hypothetical protein BURPS1106A_A0066 [Burkholderia pseudomallei 1106a]EDK51958.1 hypothetical protein BMAFMH_F0080 [Burkholderia mallei FMH]EDP84589.1 hypothetical protein BMA10399_A0643 [Burkholderia mallei ATCC 10399]EDS82141.1 hypothetical protein BURPSS13_B0015 [Burkholderia pseudomallei S13]EDU06780.1 conserved hypothetical protein [Burkholderia pseudomallei 1655]EEP86611.1 conserved hypothetical protein [Burkholderia mallei
MAASLRRAPPNRENIVRISGGRFIGIGLAAVPTSRAHCRARRKGWPANGATRRSVCRGPRLR